MRVLLKDYETGELHMANFEDASAATYISLADYGNGISTMCRYPGVVRLFKVDYSKTGSVTYILTDSIETANDIVRNMFNNNMFDATSYAEGTFIDVNTMSWEYEKDEYKDRLFRLCDI